MKSMTGYGRARRTEGDYDISVELRAVNHRYLDLTVKAPRMYGFLEEAVKKAATAHIARGKVDVYITVNTIGGNTRVVYNEKVAAQYMEVLRTLGQRFDLRDDISVMALAKMPDVLSEEKEEADADVLRAAVCAVLDGAMAEFDHMREAEGGKLREDILTRRETILSLVAQVEKRSPETVREYREKLHRRMADVLADTSIEPQRILTEAALFADRVAVDEETVRLRSHMEQLREMLEETTPVGRKLDFLVQEMNREANTIGSKANDAELAKIVVELKSEIEKIREQIQNLE